jgi:hypothetical protein
MGASILAGWMHPSPWFSILCRYGEPITASTWFEKSIKAYIFVTS